MTGVLPSFVEHYTSGRLAPYLRERRLAGSMGHMIEAAQPAGDMSDPASSDLVLTVAVSDGIDLTSDFGAGRSSGRAAAGSLFLTAPEVATDIRIRNPHMVRFLALPSGALRPHLAEARPGADPFDFGRLHAGPFRSASLLDLLDRLWSEAGSGDGVGRLYADGLSLAVCAELAREAGRPAPAARGGLAPRQLALVRELVEARLAEDLGLAELAAEAGLSPSHFTRAFRRSTGLTPHRYLMARRVERARALLEGGELALAEVALASGFADQSHFTSAFRRATGLTPGAHRRAARD